MKNFVPDEAYTFQNTEREILDEFFKWGYKPVITPLFENYETISAGLNEKLKPRTMKFVDPSTGDIVALRPDITPQISRIVATRMNHLREPQRLCYSGRVVRFEHESSGKEREVFQVGCEFMGMRDLAADAEVMALSVKALERVGLSGLILDIGHAGFLKAVDKIAGKEKARVREAFEMKSAEKLSEALLSAGLSAGERKIVCSIAGTREIKTVLRLMDKLPQLRPTGVKIGKIIEVLGEHEIDCEICVDACDVRDFNYYTGVTFQVLHERSSRPLVVGGRYDTLVKRYGYDTPATGFAADIEGIAKAVSPTAEGSGKTVHFVVIPTKSSLRKEAIRLSYWLRSNGFQVIAETKPRPVRRHNSRKDEMPPTYGVIFIENPKKLRLVESKNKTMRQFSNLEELIAGGL